MSQAPSRSRAGFLSAHPLAMCPCSVKALQSGRTPRQETARRAYEKPERLQATRGPLSWKIRVDRKVKTTGVRHRCRGSREEPSRGPSQPLPQLHRFWPGFPPLRRAGRELPPSAAVLSPRAAPSPSAFLFTKVGIVWASFLCLCLGGLACGRGDRHRACLSGRPWRGSTLP